MLSFNQTQFRRKRARINCIFGLLAASTAATLLLQTNSAFAADPESSTTSPKSYRIPAGSLSSALATYATQSGILLTFPPALTDGKSSPGLSGNYDVKDGFQQILKGTGLAPVRDQRGGYYLEKLPEVKGENNLPLDVKLDTVNVRAKRFYEIGPLPGLGLTKEEIPGNVQSISAAEIKASHSLSLTDLLNKKLQSVNVNDYAGNPFQMDVTYRGFTAGPQIGTPQGLSVFFDGIRVNEPFGDVVNWDMIPMNAISSVDVFPGSNPIFGLNTLGGAFTLKTKDGFSNEGVDAQVLTGSYGRKQLQVEGGWNNGTVALFGAGNFFMEDGWRVNSPSKVNQFFGKASYRGDKLDLNLSTLLVKTDLVGNGLVPNQLYQEDRDATFTSEDTTGNKLAQFQLSGAFQVNDSFNVTGQVYHRKSDRHAIGADAYMDGFGPTPVQRDLAPGEQYTCLYLSTSGYKIPDYYVIDIDPNTGSNVFIDDFNSNSGSPGYDLNASIALAGATVHKNGVLPAYYASAAEKSFDYWKNFVDTFLYGGLGVPAPLNPGPVTDYSNGDYSYLVPDATLYILPKYNVLDLDPNLDQFFNYFYTTDGVKHIVTTQSPINKADCFNNPDLNDHTPGVDLVAPDGAGQGGTGLVAGIPVSVLTDNNINQIVDGGSVQLNWNFEKHKFMIGASIDVASASYSNTQQLGLFDNDRKAYLSDDIYDYLSAAHSPISNNNFEGTSTTKSIYASETWSPIETLHITGSARYNSTHVKNTVATRTAFSYFELAQYREAPDFFNLCLGSVANCPTTGYRIGDGSRVLNPAETEKFSYYSLNPSLGLTWQAKPDLNLFGNWSQGTRTPSVVELGCAYDRTQVRTGNPPYVYVDKSLLENRSCTLPTTLSGDPFLPQIKATTYDVGIRGTIGENLKWNLGAYRTDLKDDIYLVTIGGANSYFDTIGNTRRQGIEAGLSGQMGKWSFGVNYALTDATFQDTFNMISEDNSSARLIDVNNPSGEAFKQISIKPGNRMPGVPLNNLNANVAYEVTDKWTVGLSAVAHSESFVRGNENNKHRPGATEYYSTNIYDPVTMGYIQASRQPYTNPGKVAGYAVFDFQTSYKFNSEWTGTMLINNVFDREYFSAGRLGRNPFSPSINGAIGPGGYNHNSDDWLAANFLAPGAPRGIWFSLNYQFDPRK